MFYDIINYKSFIFPSEHSKSMMFYGKIGQFEMQLFLDVIKNMTAAKVNINWKQIKLTQTLGYCTDIEG